jgi:hypothetical protein
LWRSRALAAVSSSVGLAPWATLLAYLAIMALAGLLYGRIFMRAANDWRGGWLFGIGYGFLLWMLGPITLMQWWRGQPIVVGGASQGLFAAHLAYGLILGALYPAFNRITQRRAGERLRYDRDGDKSGERYGADVHVPDFQKRSDRAP